MTLPDWCPRFRGTQAVGKGFLVVFLLIIFSWVVYPQVTVKQVTLIIDGQVETIMTRANNVAQLLEEEGLYARDSDMLSPGLDAKVERGMEITLRRAIPVFLETDGKTRLVYTTAANVEELLRGLDIRIEAEDRVVPGMDEALAHGAKLVVTRVSRERVEEEVPIPYRTEQLKNPDLLRGRQTVVTEGQPGILLRIYEIVYANGEEEERRLVDEKRIAEPVNKVVHVGTKESVITASARDGRVTQAIEGMASWYGAKFHGNTTAYGDIFDMYQMTAAFPDRSMYGKTLRVTYLKTGRSVDVLVNDYGPHVSGRIIDLSMAAARAIGLMADGVGRVKVEILQ
jgi:uncharacterized protein YabE (DUF348 family)